ncbi:MAG: peptide ABC transporter substrate-binding protein [Anaerolineales bacterium]|nr:peptide ABC transporter substrate-binding protein [Anaerolineales bacterium]MCB9128592.1 peptide ABC transporter substrate-binding protein [Ardenticatenales bacterium]MCB9172530.1 peptide ABC transporter substrate-binding protein [Ardenticatenales bacterium]
MKVDHARTLPLLLIVALLLAACEQPALPLNVRQAEPTAVALPAELSYNFGDGPLTLDPLYASDRPSLDLVTQLFDGLTALDPTSAEPQPALAEVWDVSADGRTYTFRLRAGVSWIDGRGETRGEVTADDVAYAIRRACRPDAHAPSQRLLFIISECRRISEIEGIPDLESVGVRAVDRYVVEFELIAPAAYFPTILAMPVAFPVPSSSVEPLGDGWTNQDALLTNGPFRLVDGKTEARLQLVKNDYHYDAANIALVSVEGQRLSEGAALTAFRDGALDAMRLSPQLATTLDSANTLPVNVETIADQCVVGYGITLIKGPMDSRRLRQALTSAIDRNAIVALLAGDAQTAHHFAPPVVFGSLRDNESAVQESISQAQALLAAAGYPSGAGLPALSLAYPDNQVDGAVARAISEMWQTNLGVTTELRSLPSEDFLRMMKGTVPPSEMPHLWLLRWCGTLPDENAWLAAVLSLPDEFASDFYPADSRNTIEARANPMRRVAGDLDPLLDEAREADDSALRQQLYADAERLAVVDEVFLIPLYYTTTTWAYQPWLSSAEQNAIAPLLERWELDMRQKVPPTATPTPY